MKHTDAEPRRWGGPETIRGHRTPSANTSRPRSRLVPCPEPFSRSTTCYKAIGFKSIGDVVQEEEKCELLVYDSKSHTRRKLHGATMSEGVSVPEDLRKKLVDEMSGSELQSLLIRVFSDRASLASARSVLESWLKDRFVRPSSISPRDFADLAC